MSDFIPNSFQVPNAYIDRIWHLLTPQEQSVLIYMARRIFGFNKRQDRISISQFTQGTRSRKDRRSLDGGTGLGADAVRRALSGLIEFGLACEESPATHEEGALFSLQLDGSRLDLAGLEERRAAKSGAARERTRASRAIISADRAIQEVGATEGLGVGGTDPKGSVGQRHNKQGETQLEKQGLSKSKSVLESNSNSYSEDQPVLYDDSLFDEDEI